ncbi:hypothetical protein vseg_000337 [Gypsophila vaccaria]
MSVKRGRSEIIDEEIEFSWGKKRGRGGAKKNVQFYESFKFDGVEYSLYDSVYLFKKGEMEPYVAVHENELFLGAGEGTGLTNLNPLEAIAGKCNVVCTSKDSRNRQPSAKELEMADFIFYRTFDVNNLTISDKLDAKIAMVDVTMLLNKNDHRQADLAKLDNVKAAVDAAKTRNTAENILVASDHAKLDDDNVAVAAAKQLISAEARLADLSAGKLGTDESDKTALVAGIGKKETLNKDTDDKVVPSTSDKTALVAGIGKKETLNKDTDDKVVPSTSKQVLESGQKTNLKSLDLKKTKLQKVGQGTVVATATENGKLLLANDVKKQIVAGGNQSEDRLSKKLNRDGARKNIVSGGTSNQKSVNVSPASNKTTEPVGRAAAIIEGDKLTLEVVGISDTPPRKQKYEGLVDEKSYIASGKQSKDLKNSVGKDPELPSRAIESNDKRKLPNERDGTSEGLSRKRKANNLIERKPNDKSGKVSTKQPYDGQVEGGNEVKEVVQRQVDTSKWFTASSWEDRMKFACDEERLILLQNLDPTYNSLDVENIVRDGFGENCNVKIVPRTKTSSPHTGQAFVIFNKREAAQKVIAKLERSCLMLPNGRPLVGTINTDVTSLPGKQSQFFGHLVLDKLKHQKEMKDAVSTSHSTQPNTIEYEMALEWRLLQDQSDLWWKLLYQKQGEEIKQLKASLKSK